MPTPPDKPACLKRRLPLALLCCIAGSASQICEAEVVIRGIEGELHANALAIMGLDDESCEVPAWRVNRAYEDAIAEIRESLEVFGYYSASIESSLERDESCWHAEFDVVPGDPVLLRDVRLELVGEAQASARFQALLEGSQLRSGLPFLHSEYEGLKTRMLTLAQQRGYVEARFSANRVDVYPDENVADVALVFDSGPRYRFGEITLDQDVLRDDLVMRYLGFKTGDFFDGQLLAASQIDLNNTGFFNTVNVATLPARSESLEIPINVTLTPARRKLLSYGVGVATDTGPRVRFGRNIRRWNDRGHQMTLQAQLSPVLTEINANYRLPLEDPRTEWLSFDAGALLEETDTSESDSLQLGARRIRERNSNWTRTELVNFMIEDFQVGQQSGRAHLLMPGIEWSRLISNDGLRPTRGHRVNLELRGAADNLASNTSFAQFVGKAKWIRGFGEKNRVLLRGEVGVTKAQHFSELPPSVRFFAGGDNSVRGYRFETLGPTDENGDVVGGSRLITGSIEYERQVRRQWSIAVFADGGNAFHKSDFTLKRGAGIGARWLSPLGPMRIDLAKPLDSSDRGVILHVVLGPDL